MSNTNSKRMIGLMSGTSVDSIDALLCDVYTKDNGKIGLECLSFLENPVNANLRSRIFEAFKNQNHGISLLCSLNFEIGRAFGETTIQLINKWGGDKSTINAIASHGQTIYHIAPHMVSDNSQVTASTLQIGEGSVIAEMTKLPVISDFRVADMAAGGNGAPLVPYLDYHLFSQDQKGVVVHNLGGIANLTWLPVQCKPEDVLAFDTGPANMIIDALVNRFYPGEYYDKNGDYARQGTIISELLNQWMSIPYISASPPKSTGRELFGVQFALDSIIPFENKYSANDFIATATEFTALSFYKNLELHVYPKGIVNDIYLAGGGARNPYLVDRISKYCNNEITRVFKLDDIGFASQARECAGFAMMGYANLNRIPNNLPSVTGALHPCILGKLSIP